MTSVSLENLSVPGFTDDGLAKLFTMLWEDRFLCVDGDVYEYADGVYVGGAEASLLHKIRLLNSDVAKKAKLKEGTALYRKMHSANTVNAVAKLVRNDPKHATVRSAFDPDLWLLNHPSCATDTRTSRRLAQSRAHRCTKRTSVDPKGDAPLWRETLQQIFGDAEIIAYVQRFLGYCLTGYTREQVVLIGYGTGANGKSLIFDVFLAIHGDYGATLPPGFMAAHANDRHPTEHAMLEGVRAAVAMETELGQRFDEAKFKQSTGGGRFAVRGMRENFRLIELLATFIVIGNHKPPIRNVDVAMRRRIHFLKFPNTFPNPDRQLKEKLLAESSGILQWCIQGARDWSEKGLMPPPSVLSDAEEYLSAQDTIGAWVTECCDSEANLWTSSASLFQSWERWAKERGEFVGSQQRLIGLLEGKGFARGKNRSGTVRGVYGIALVSDTSGHRLDTSWVPA